MAGGSRRTSTSASHQGDGGGGKKVDQTRLAIERMEAERERRRRAMVAAREERSQEVQKNLAAGNPGDVDFIGLVRRWRAQHPDAGTVPSKTRQQQQQSQQPHPLSKICVCVRKRPISSREKGRRDHDCVTCLGGSSEVWVHAAKTRVDGITKYLDHNSFRFDHSFGEDVDTETVYQRSTEPLVRFVCAGGGGRATVFAYGQTGSGKTYTMAGIQAMVAEDIFSLLENDTISVTVAFFELYGTRIQDLLNGNRKLRLLEDGKGEVVVTGLEEFEANDPSQLLSLIERGNQHRTTHATEANDSSSRSHAICQLLMRRRGSGKLVGKLSLVDLAGSERGVDTKQNNQQRRNESSEINKSLLALKECIRALGASHVPYRGSKLTLILKDCFTSQNAVTTMIAAVSPASSSADHTLNTLRYADRVKERKIVSSTSTSPRNGNGTAKRDAPQTTTAAPRSPSLSLSDAEDDDDIDEFESPSPQEDIDDEAMDENDNDDEDDFHRDDEALYEQEEDLLNLHMSVIQENAELLTEEGRLLKSVQGDHVEQADIDKYASRLRVILERKTSLIHNLQINLNSFRSRLKLEEDLTRKFGVTSGSKVR